MTQAYSDPSRESDPHALPDVEVFYVSAAEAKQHAAQCVGAFDADYQLQNAGWYWWSCFPGCLPDSDPCGPFATEEDALADAQRGSE